MKKSLLAFMAAFVVMGCSDLNIGPKSNQETTNEDFNLTAQSTSASAVAYSYVAQSNGTVKFSFVNTTSDTLNGDLIREGVSFLQNGTIITYFSVLPGATYTYIDDNVQANETYRYIFEYTHAGSGEYQIFIDEVSVVSDVPAIGNFTLIAAAYDDEYEVLTNGYTINLAGVNIRAEANADKTGSIEFFLNGKKFHDNDEPYNVYVCDVAGLEGK
jgi:hypothetical protein